MRTLLVAVSQVWGEDRLFVSVRLSGDVFLRSVMISSQIYIVCKYIVI